MSENQLLGGIRFALFAEWLLLSVWMVAAVVVDAQGWDEWAAAEFNGFPDGVPNDQDYLHRLVRSGAAATPLWLLFTVVWLGAARGCRTSSGEPGAPLQRLSLGIVAGVNALFVVAVIVSAVRHGTIAAWTWSSMAVAVCGVIVLLAAFALTRGHASSTDPHTPARYRTHS